jgi:hypothetical protein
LSATGGVAGDDGGPLADRHAASADADLDPHAGTAADSDPHTDADAPP